MKTLIVYATTYDFAKECAGVLQEELEGAVDTVNIEKKDFDTANLLQKSKKEHNTPRYAAILGNIKGYFRCSYKCWCLVGV